MPHRSPTAPPATPKRPPGASFRQRYDMLETRRAALVARLTTLADTAQDQPAYKSARTLLNDTFRRTRLPQRLAVLQAAAWLIDILEKLSMTV